MEKKSATELGWSGRCTSISAEATQNFHDKSDDLHSGKEGKLTVKGQHAGCSDGIE